MSLLRRVLPQPERRFYSASSAGDPWAIPSNGSLAAFTSAGVPVTEDTALQLAVVHRAVALLADAVSTLPLNTVKYSGPLQGGIWLRQPDPLIVSDPFGGLNAISGVTRREGLQQMMVSLLLRGNAYAVVTARDGYGYPTHLSIVHPDAVKIGVKNDQVSLFYEINKQVLDPVDVMHLRGMSLPGSKQGLSVIGSLRQAIGLGLAAEEFGARFFGTGATLTGIIEVPGDLDNDRARQLKERFQSQHGGLKNAHTVGVLTGGAKWAPISVSPEDAQFLGTRAAQNLDLAMVFGIPPHLLGQVDRTTSWGTGIEQQTIGFVRYTLNRWIGLFEDAWSACLPEPVAAKFDLDSLLRGDTAGRYSVYSSARAAGLLTQNEIRARENMPPIPGGDDINAPLNSGQPSKPDDGAAMTPKGAAESGAVI